MIWLSPECQCNCFYPFPFFFPTKGTNNAQTKIHHYKDLLKVCSLFFCAVNAIKCFLLCFPHLLKQLTLKTIKFGGEGTTDPKQRIILCRKGHSPVNSNDILTVACCQPNGLTYTTTSNYY